MTARSARAARHRRIPQAPKPAQVTVYRLAVAGQQWLAAPDPLFPGWVTVRHPDSTP